MAEKLELSQLFEIIKTKINQKEQGSYTYELSQKGLEKITRKVGEEALEVVIASFVNEKNPTAKNKEDLTKEICDLFYHTLVLMAFGKIEFDDILEEFNKRNKK